MDDPLKKLADQSINGKPGAPRFHPGQLMYTEINNRYVTFYLRTHAVAVTIEDLTAEEASLARLYYRDPARQPGNEKAASDYDGPKTADVSAVQKDSLILDNTDDPDLENNENISPTDFMSGPQPLFNGRIGSIFVIGFMVLIFGILIVTVGPDILSDIQFNNDKSTAISIATQDDSIRQFMKGKDLALDSSAWYYDPAREVSTGSYSKFMLVQVMVFGMIDHGNNNEIVLEQFDVIVDLEKKSIVRTKEYSRM